MSTQPNGLSRSRAVLSLEYPMSLGRYDTYDKAQKAVDYLSDHEFPVAERPDRRHRPQAARAGHRPADPRPGGHRRAGVRPWLGLFVGMVFALFDTSSGRVGGVVVTVAFGAVFGLAWALIGYAVTGAPRLRLGQPGRRDAVRGARRAQVRRRRPVSCSPQMDPMAAAQAQVDAAREAERQRLASQTQPPQPPL